MTPERWAQVEELFQRAVECEPEELSRLLDEACNGDPDLRGEVESLLSCQKSAGHGVKAAVRMAIDSIGFPLLGQTVSHYRILDGLGCGGMGVVYRAEDLKLGRRIALKFLPEELGSDSQALERFSREARAASSLDHPNICPIYEFGEHEGRPFIVMQLLDGQTLRDRLGTGDGSLPLEDLLDIGLQVSAGLQAAHEKGIVHRDIKPANIFLTNKGACKILDFGLAKLLEGGKDDETAAGLDATAFDPPSASGGTHLTRTGLAVGTPGYMSPEQVRGEKLDARTDLFSLGLVLYEMATGQRPFLGGTAAEVNSSILGDTPKPVTELRPELPAALQKIVEHCLAKEIKERYFSAGELREAVDRLRREIVPGSRGTTVAGASAGASIAVLPFTNMSVDPESGFFADGITEEIMNALTQIDDLHVAARSSSFSFKGKHVDLHIVGERLNVKTVLEGSVRKAGNRLRIMAQLTNVAEGYQLWSERYDRELNEIFEVQDEIARAIAGRLKVALKTGQQPSVKAGTSNLEAYQLYLKGRALLYRRGLDIRRSAQCFERAVAIDPQYPLAWSGLADSRSMLGFYGFERPGAIMPQAKEAATRAVTVDPMLAEAHCSLAITHLLHDWEWANAEREFLRALALNPRYLQNLAWYGVFYLVWIQRRFDESIALAKRGVESDPLSGYAHTILANAYFQAGRGAEAVLAANSGRELEESFVVYWASQNAFHSDRQFDKAAAAGEIALALSGRHPWALSAQAMIYADWGKIADAQAIYAELVARAARGYIQPVHMAIAASAAGESDRAVAHAREAFEVRDPFLVAAKYWPDLVRIREDPRFDEILVGMGLK